MTPEIPTCLKITEITQKCWWNPHRGALKKMDPLTKFRGHPPKGAVVYGCRLHLLEKLPGQDPRIGKGSCWTHVLAGSNPWTTQGLTRRRNNSDTRTDNNPETTREKIQKSRHWQSTPEPTLHCFPLNNVLLCVSACLYVWKMVHHHCCVNLWGIVSQNIMKDVMNKYEKHLNLVAPHEPSALGNKTVLNFLHTNTYKKANLWNISPLWAAFCATKPKMSKAKDDNKQQNGSSVKGLRPGPSRATTGRQSRLWGRRNFTHINGVAS